ncbi:MAG: hypothetical protein M3522_03480 [Actinomycetota bacterium]|nr:hypothetical protein [Actinomycetota bacterium]
MGGALFLAFPLVGAMIASKRPENAVGWLCLAVGLLWTLIGAFEYYSYYGAATPGSVPFPVAIAGISDWMWVPAMGLLGTYVLLLFPDGRLPSRRWRPLAWLSGAVILLLSLVVVLAPGRLGNLAGVRKPFGIEGAEWLTAGAYVLLPLLPLCMLASALSLVLRYRRSGGEERQQIKWMAFSASVVVVLYAMAMVVSVAFPEESWTTAGSVWWLNLLTYVVLASFTTVPIAVGIAVLKYRLYEIDVIINRALVYAALTATLALSYLGSVVTLQYVLRALTGQESTLAVVASTLAVAALFNPLRRRVQALVDRRFYRRKYDAAKTLEAFSARLREETDLDALGQGLVGPRAGGSGTGNGAARARLLVDAPRGVTEGRAGGLGDPLFTGVRGKSPLSEARMREDFTQDQRKLVHLGYAPDLWRAYHAFVG